MTTKTLLSLTGATMALAMALSFGSCSDEPSNLDNKDLDEFLLIDYNPINFNVACVNGQGDDLLDKNTNGNIINNDIKIKYDGQWYPLSESPESPHESRYYLPTWYNPYIGTVKDPDGVMKKVIRIGEIDGSTNGTTVVTLSIGNRVFKLKATNKIKKATEVTRHYYLDGKKIDNDRGFYSIILK